MGIERILEKTTNCAPALFAWSKMALLGSYLDSLLSDPLL